MPPSDNRSPSGWWRAAAGTCAICACRGFPSSPACAPTMRPSRTRRRSSGARSTAPVPSSNCSCRRGRVPWRSPRSRWTSSTRCRSNSGPCAPIPSRCASTRGRSGNPRRSPSRRTCLPKAGSVPSACISARCSARRRRGRSRGSGRRWACRRSASPSCSELPACGGCCRSIPGASAWSSLEAPRRSGCAGPGPAGGQLFAAANAAYLSGDVARATAAYEALVSEGVASTELETNLGAAYLRQGKRGLAVLHFERALYLQPGDDDASADLVEVRRGNVDRLEGDADEAGAETVARLLTPLPGTAAAAILAVLWPAAWVLFGLRLLRGGPRWAAVAAAGCFGGALLFALLTWGAAAGRDMAMRRGVVVAQAVPAREGPAEKSLSRFEVQEGTTVSVDDEEAGFRRVKLANGLTGWVPAGTVELVVPPGWAGRPVLTGSARAVQP